MNLSRTTVAFAFFAVVLFGSQLGLYRATADQAHAASWVPHTYQAIEAIRSITDGVALAESSLRAFAVTGEQSVIPAFEQGIARTKQGLADSRQLTRASAIQQERLRELAPAVEQRLAQLHHALELARAGEAPEQVVTRERLRMSELLRTRAAVMIETERAFLAARLAQSAEQTSHAQRISLLGMLLATLLCGSGLWVITRQNRTLRDAEEELRLTVAEAPIGVGLITPTGRWLRVNDALCRILGQPRAELLQRPWEQTLHPADRGAAAAQVEALLHGQVGAEPLELRCLRQDGQLGFIAFTASLVRASTGAPRFLVADVQDISGRRLAEMEARLFFEQSADMLAIAESPGKLQKVNAAWQRTLGWTPEQLTAAPYLDLVHPDDRARTGAAAQEPRSDNSQSLALRNRLRDVEGRYHCFDWRMHPTHDGRLFCTVRDVTEQVEREQALHVLREAIAATSSGVLMTNPSEPDNPVTYINPAFVHMTGYSPEELLGKSCRVLQGEDRDQPAISQLREAIRQERGCKVVLRNYRKNGELFLNALTISPVRDATGAVARFVGISEDVTERQRDEQQIRMLATITQLTSEQQALDSALNRILHELCETQGWDYGELWRKAENGEDITCRGMCYAREGAALAELCAARARGSVRSESDMVQRVWSSARPEWCEDLQSQSGRGAHVELMLQAQLRTAVAVPIGPGEGVLHIVRSRRMPQDARILHLLTTVAGQIGMFIQRKRAELALRASEERLNHATRATSDVVFDCALDTKQLWLSEAVLRNFGYDVNQVHFDWWAERLHPNDASAVLSTLQAACAGEQTHWAHEYRFACSNERYAHVVHRLFILRDEHGKAVRVIGSMMDISERVKNEAALHEAKISAEAAARAKTAFLANMSHEIRTPLTALLGFADLLLDPNISQSDRRSYAATIRSNGEHLLAVLNDVLDVAKLESGKLTIEHIYFSPAKLLDEVASLMEVKAVEKGLSFSAATDPPLPAAVRGDPTRLRQVLLNLLSNAIKFTESGSVRVTAYCEARAGGPDAELEIRVRDTGIGMDASQVQRLFQPFSQADSSTTRRFAGSGLGLAICGALVRAMGGVIEVQTAPQQGSEFTLRLPVQIGREIHDAADLAGDASLDEQRQRGSILLAEDGPDNQRLISTVLRQRGFDVEIVDDGIRAVERALAAASAGSGFDVILMDMQMPRLDGYQATARLRACGYDRPILALTAHAMEGDRKRCIAAGCDDHLAKPIHRHALLRAVASHVQRAQRLGSDVHGQQLAPANDVRTPQPSAPAAMLPRLTSELAEDAVLRDLVHGFVAALPAQVAALRAAAGSGDREQLLRLVQQLKGAAGGYGFPSITEAAHGLEQALRADPAAPLSDASSELLRLCESTQPQAQRTRATAAQSTAASVLAIDDSAVIRELIRVYLAGEGMELRFASTARDGLASAVDRVPDVILLDLELPDMSGLNVCRELKQEVRTANVPVLFLTGTEDKAIKATAFELGAIDYVTKPFDKIELSARVRSALRVKRYQDLLAARAQIDGLTGLWNRAYFNTRFREEIAFARRHNRPLSVALLDLDHFKKINDTYGHPFGDHVLQSVASALVRTLRTGDVACRYGGEELVVILRDTAASEAAIAADRILRTIAGLALDSRGENVRVTVSIGVSSLSGPTPANTTARQAELLLAAADSALYRAKHEGRARVVTNPLAA